MRIALLLTIGTEITAGEVVNTNASWVSQRLEELGARVYSHLTVRDHRQEILRALEWSKNYDWVVVTGGLGPTSDDITRSVMAEFTGQPLEFDDSVWAGLSRLYVERGLPLREAHRHQCWFPKGSRRLSNSVGTALGFSQNFEGRSYYVLPGPPRELEAMWLNEVEPELTGERASQCWVRWTCIGIPESEVAELVEAKIAGLNLEVGYRAQVPYVKVKIFVDPKSQGTVVSEIENVLAPYLVARGEDDLAEELLRRWPKDTMSVQDSVTGTFLFSRLLTAQRKLGRPQLSLNAGEPGQAQLCVSRHENEFLTKVATDFLQLNIQMSLPYKLGLGSERGQRSAAEWVIWNCVRHLRTSST